MVTTTYTTETSFAAPKSIPGVNISGLNLVITPSATDSVIELKFNLFNEVHHDVLYRITRNINGTDVLVVPETNILKGGIGVHVFDDHHTSTPQVTKIRWYDEPNTTSAVTYKLWVNTADVNSAVNRTIYVNRSGAIAHSSEHGVSTAAAIEHPKPQQSLTTVTNASQVEGQVLETLAGQCDGQSIIVNSGTYTIPSRHRICTQLAIKIYPKSISYKPPAGIVKLFIIFFMARKVLVGIIGSFKLFLDSTEENR